MSKDQSISQQQLEEIESFLRHEMPEEERGMFEARIKKDVELKKLTDEIRLLFIGIQESSLTKSLAGFHNGLSEKKITTVFKLDTRWMVAASLFIIASVAAWLLLTSDSDNEKLYSKYYQPDPGLMTAMGTTDNYLFEQGMVNYKSGEYKKALDSWSPLLVKNPSSDTLQYFIGVANHALGNDATARQHIEIIVKDSTNAFYQDACWYLGLLLLKQGEMQAAKTYIEKSSHTQKTELLNAINRKE